MTINLSVLSRNSNEEPRYQRFVDSYALLRFIIGLASFMLPITVLVWGLFLDDAPWFNGKTFAVADSLSAYYYTPARNVFIGVLWAVGAFLIAYVGENRKQNAFGYVAGLSAIVVASVPTGAPIELEGPNPTSDVGPIVHGAFAATFFIVMAGFSMLVFTRRTENKSRCTVYRNISHWLIGAGILALLGVLFVEGIGVFEFESSAALLWFEFAALMLVGVSWMLEFVELFPGWFRGRVRRMRVERSSRSETELVESA